MGLEEKRKIKEFQDSIVPNRAKELAGICGCDIAYEVDWPSFADETSTLLTCSRDVACPLPVLPTTGGSA
jgi:hypothetical protein